MIFLSSLNLYSSLPDKKGNVFVTLEPHLQTFDGLNALATKSFDNPYKYPNQQVAFLDAFGKLKELL